MRFRQFLFQTVADFVRFALTFINVIAQSLFALTMANLASAVDHSQRALDMVVTEFHAAFTLVRHMAIGTRDTSLAVNTHLTNFIIGMLRFQNRRAAQFMDIIVKTGLIIIGFHVFYRETFVPRESQIFAVAFEVIFYMALRAYQ